MDIFQLKCPDEIYYISNDAAYLFWNHCVDIDVNIKNILDGLNKPLVIDLSHLYDLPYGQYVVVRAKLVNNIVHRIFTLRSLLNCYSNFTRSRYTIHNTSYWKQEIVDIACLVKMLGKLDVYCYEQRSGIVQ